MFTCPGPGSPWQAIKQVGGGTSRCLTPRIRQQNWTKKLRVIPN
jgi:hypothetical protein